MAGQQTHAVVVVWGVIRTVHWDGKYVPSEMGGKGKGVVVPITMEFCASLLHQNLIRTEALPTPSMPTPAFNPRIPARPGFLLRPASSHLSGRWSLEL